MDTAYNVNLFNRFKNNLVMLQSDEAYMLCLKSGSDQLKVIGFLSTRKVNQNLKTVIESWAVSGFGNILYAFVMMNLNETGFSLCPDREGNLTDYAWHLWISISTNTVYKKEMLNISDFCVLYEESTADDLDISISELLDKYKDNKLIPDLRNFSYTLKKDGNYEQLFDFNSDIARQLREESVKFFYSIHCDEDSTDSQEIQSLKTNNYNKLNEFINK